MKLPKLSRKAKASPEALTAPKPAKTKRLKFRSAWGLFRDSFREFIADWKPYTKIIAIVAIPINVLPLLAGSDSDSGGDPLLAFLPFAAIVMNVALIWAIVRRGKTGKAPTVAQAYYDGSAVFVRYLLVSMALVFMLIPAAFGAALYAASLYAVDPSALFGPEQALIGFVALVLASPTAFLLVRYGLGLVATVNDDLRPVAALRRSRALTIGRFWPVAGRLLMLGLFLALASLPATAVTFGLSFIRLGEIAATFFEIAATFIALPLANLYIYNLYKALEATPAQASSPAASTTETDTSSEAAPASV
jgi:hypothetical protein